MFSAHMFNGKRQHQRPWRILYHIRFDIVSSREILCSEKTEQPVMFGGVGNLLDSTEANHAREAVPPLSRVLVGAG